MIVQLVLVVQVGQLIVGPNKMMLNAFSHCRSVAQISMISTWRVWTRNRKTKTLLNEMTLPLFPGGCSFFFPIATINLCCNRMGSFNGVIF